MKFKDIEDIYKQYYRDVYYFLLSMNSDPELSEELTQETFYRTLTSIHKFKDECQLQSWLCQIGKNAYLSWIKKQKHLAGNVSAPEESRAAGEKGKQEENSPEALYIRKDEALSIYKVLHLLQEPYKEVFILRPLGELSYKEIGEIFGRGEDDISPGEIKDSGNDKGGVLDEERMRSCTGSFGAL